MQCILFTHVNLSYGLGRYTGAYRLATELREHGYSTQVIDYWSSFSDDELDKILDRYVDKDTLFVGFSSTLIGSNHTPKSTNDLIPAYTREATAEQFYKTILHDYQKGTENLFRRIKCKYPHIKIIIGGRKIDLLPAFLNEVDYWFYGESDVSIIKFADHLSTNSPFTTTVNMFNGTQRGRRVNGNDYPVTNFKHAKITWSKNDFLFENEHVPIEVARGCIFKCKFCVFTPKKKGEFVKDINTLREELMYNYENFGVTSYMIADDTLNDSMDKINDLHELFISMPFKMEWSAYARIDMIYRYPEMIKFFKDAGCASLFFGVETLNEKSGKAVGKGLKPELVIETLAKCRQEWGDQINMSGGFIVGLPYETKESMAKTFDYLHSDDCALDAWHINPLSIITKRPSPTQPLSMFAQDLEKYGYGNDDDDNKSWTNENFSLATAKEMLEEFNRDQRTLQKNNVMGAFTYHNRMKNLGYTHDEIQSMTLTDPWWYDDSNKRSEIKKAEYYNKLINGIGD